MANNKNANHNGQTVVKWLSQGGLRPTRQRVILAERLIGDGQNRHVTAESLFAISNERSDKVSLATVYNTLRAFCSVGLLREITVDGSKSYFDTNVSDHPHFYWEDSSDLVDAPAKELRITSLPQVPAGAEISKVDVVIRLRRKLTE
jgi:Fur family iron response transcriptional regulator|tara:strand:+ start:836 stop:1276 length:441 start_codon:yes stop_codon:yes gene_type:complete